MYRAILADPPWKYDDKLRQSDVCRSADDQYHTMSTDDICKLADPRRQLIMGQQTAQDATLFLWVTCPFLLNGDGVRVCKAWGFNPKQLFTWVKGDLRDGAIVGALGMGHHFRVDTEHLVLATRGRMPAMRHDMRNYVFLEPKGGHSEKPVEIYDIIETVVPGPYLELFARTRQDGWDQIGDELP
jgi:N6-adenosine-specific RNA methylase IME4